MAEAKAVVAMAGVVKEEAMEGVTGEGALEVADLAEATVAVTEEDSAAAAEGGAMEEALMAAVTEEDLAAAGEAETVEAMVAT